MGLLDFSSKAQLRACAAAILVALAPAVASAETMAVVDARNETVQVPVAPKRIASVSFFAVDVALALGEMPVATTYMAPGREPDYLMGLTKGIAKIGQRAKPNLELLSEAKPDLIVAMKRYTVGNAARFQAIAPYVAFNNELLTESYSEVAELAKILGKPERGAELNAAFTARLEDYARKAPQGVHPKFVIMFAGDAPFAFHTGNTAASIVAGIGGDNIVGAIPPGGRFGTNISLEAVLEKDPDVIFIIDWGQERTHEANPIWSRLSAVRNKRVFYVADEWAETNGPIARELVLREAAHYLYPQAFPAVDVKAEAAKLIPAALQK